MFRAGEAGSDDRYGQSRKGRQASSSRAGAAAAVSTGPARPAVPGRCAAPDRGPGRRRRTAADRSLHPAGGRPVPDTAHSRTPYGRGFPWDYVYGAQLAAQGFHVLIQSCRGTGGSGGVFDMYRHERADGQATVAWLRQQDWFRRGAGNHRHQLPRLYRLGALGRVAAGTAGRRRRRFRRSPARSCTPAAPSPCRTCWSVPSARCSHIGARPSPPGPCCACAGTSAGSRQPYR